MVNLNDVAIFVNVARSGSFAAASRRLGIPTNTISRRVQLLEEQLGIRLMQRSTRKLSLTTAGQEFFDRCSGAIAGLESAEAAMLADRDQPSGSMRIAVMADFFDFFPMEWIAEFLAAHPRVRVDFALSDGRVDLIEEQVDAAIRAGTIPDSSMIVRPLIAARDGGLYAAPAYLAARGTPEVLRDLADHDCVTFRDPMGRATWRLVDAAGSSQEVQVSGRITVDTAKSLRRAAEAGLGIALLPPGLAWPSLQAGTLVPVLRQYACAGQTLQVLYSSRRQVPLAVTRFIEFLSAKLGDVASLPQPLKAVVMGTEAS